MEAQRSLSPGQRLALESTHSFTRAAVVYLRACLPIVREEDGQLLKSLIELGELSLTRLSEYFPEVRPLVRGGAQ